MSSCRITKIPFKVKEQTTTHINLKYEFTSQTPLKCFLLFKVSRYPAGAHTVHHPQPSPQSLQPSKEVGDLPARKLCLAPPNAGREGRRFLREALFQSPPGASSESAEEAELSAGSKPHCLSGRSAQISTSCLRTPLPLSTPAPSPAGPHPEFNWERGARAPSSPGPPLPPSLPSPAKLRPGRGAGRGGGGDGKAA